MAEDHKTEINPESSESMEQETTLDNVQNINLESTFKELDLIKMELSEQKDKYLRLFAEFDNYKKRTIKERIDLMRNASQELIQELLVVLDDFDRAKKISEDQKNEEIFPEGMKLVQNKLLNILYSKGLEVMDTEEKLFDPQFHEAITEIQLSDEKLKGKIYETLEKGYLLNHKIIRFAKVVVVK